jgi:predicted branched-subunit amino acid permease
MTETMTGKFQLRGMQMTVNKREFFRGARSGVPLMIGVIPFGLVLGLAAREAGLTSVQSVFFSTALLGGTAQLASVQLFGAQASAVVVIATAVIINLRYSMYSLSLYQLLKERSFPERLFAAYCVSDQSYAVTMAEYERAPGSRFISTFFLGASMAIFFVWACSILVGYNLGTVIPPELSLDFTIPLVFMSLLIPHLKGWDRQVSALVGGVAAVILVPRLPLQSGLLVAILLGIGAGTAAGYFRKPESNGGEG